MLAVAPAYPQLALHALAHLPLAGPGSLHDPRYVAWARARLPEEAVAPVARDAATIAALHEAAGRPAALQLVPELHDALDVFVATGRRELRALDGRSAHAGALAALRALDPALVELLRAGMLLAAPAWRDAWPAEACERGVELLAPALDEARELCPALAEAGVEVAWALGARGRAFASRILVGAPGDWGGLAPETAAVLAMHEASVRAAGGDFVDAEWAALGAVARAVDGASPPLRAAHRAWLAGLSLDALLPEAVARGRTDEATASTLRARPEARAALLAGALGLR